ncbi:MAG: redoxin domain-containing protein [Acidimicrobiia bacterium]|nr:redoxin domain-containing protein [Acidimicrobiia bacterium]NNC75125.1 redoxin domain-containing protein [Acidimicrobiia bacterium]
MNTRIVLGVGLGLLVVGILVVSFSTRFGTSPDVTASPLIGTTSPTWSASTIDGDAQFDTSLLAGDIVVVNFWASWCTGCRVEHEALLEAAEAFAPFDVQFVGVLYQDNPERGRSWLEEVGRSRETIYVVDEGSRVGLDYGVFGLPETFFVDRNGTIVAKKTGVISAGELSTVLNQIILGETVGRLEPGDLSPVG